jgi:chemotaxis protein MotC
LAIPEEHVRNEGETEPEDTGSGMSPFAPPAETSLPAPGDGAEARAEIATSGDPAFDGFLANGHSKIEEIDALLEEEGK